MAEHNTIPRGPHEKRVHQLHVRLSRTERTMVHERIRQIAEAYAEVPDGVTFRVCEAEVIRAALRLWLATDVRDASGRVVLKGIR